MAELHVVFVILSFIVVLVADEQGLMWFLGKKEALSKKFVELLHVLVSIGIAGLLLTGGLMFIERSEYLLGEPVFIGKMVFVLALVINGFFIGATSRLASEKSFKELTPSERARVFISGGVSFIGWVGAIIFGLLLSN